MILLILALLTGFLTLAAVWVTFNLIAAVIPALLLAIIVYFIMARRIASKTQLAMTYAVSEIQKGRIERGIALLEEVKKDFGHWQFFTKSAIDGQIGSLYYMRQNFAKAKPYLEKSFSRHWNARAMLAILAFKKKDYKQMDSIFKTATRYSPKQGLLWSVWAYCYWKAGDSNKAIEILLAGQKKLDDSDAHLIANLHNLQNNKKMKMNGYGREWLQFHLEPIPQPQQQVRYVRR